jgi:indole-3-glycerol phosphate synthase
VELRSRVPAARLAIAESGILTAGDVELLRRGGIDAFLVGEVLMRTPDPGEGLEKLFRT